MALFAKAGWCAALIGLTIGWSVCHAASQKSPPDRSRLVALAAARFPGLTNCERAVLQFADVRATARGHAAACGPSSKLDDPTNDPKHADKWGHERELRASLIRWLCVDPDAVKLVDPSGINALGARIVGSLNLSSVHVPFGFVCRDCAIPEDADFGLAELDNLDLSGSYTGPIDAGAIDVRGTVGMGDGFHASGPVFFGDSRIGRDLYCSGGSFRYADSNNQPPDIFAAQRPALFLGGSRIENVVWLCCGFQANGQVMLGSATLGDLFAFGGRFNNPGQVALDANSANVLRTVYLNSYQDLPGLVANGLVSFHNAKVGGMFLVFGAKFLGKTAEPHGLEAYTMSVGGALIWTNVQLENGATLDLRATSLGGGLIDDEKSWPEPGKLQIDGFNYGGFYGGSPTDARSRLRWLSLQDGYHPQPYRELARVLRNSGDETGAREVLIAQEELRYQSLPLPARLWGAFLKITIGYGHRPLRAIIWSMLVVAIGTVMVAAGKRAGVMRLTWPETTPPPASDPTDELNPVLYSFDVFLPFVNFHQEHYWWPDADRTGYCSFFGRRIRFSGSVLRYYLWAQITAGWLLSAIFLAGVTGLIRND